MLKLGVNIDHVATLRQVRKVSYPDPYDAAVMAREGGADSLTIHLREDRRHIVDSDVVRLCRDRILPVNLELANAPDVIDLAVKERPDEACLVPERREELTTEGGLDVAGNRETLAGTIDRLTEAGIVVSLFVDPDPRQLDACAGLGVPYIELHTGAFCEAEGAVRDQLLSELIAAAEQAHELGIQVNAGHGITLNNVGDVLRIPHLDVLNIGHSIVCRAIAVGLTEAVAEMRRAMEPYPQP